MEVLKIMGLGAATIAIVVGLIVLASALFTYFPIIELVVAGVLALVLAATVCFAIGALVTMIIDRY